MKLRDDAAWQLLRKYEGMEVGFQVLLHITIGLTFTHDDIEHAHTEKH